MKRFIDLGTQMSSHLEQRNFAWYDDIRDRFETHGGRQYWTNWDEFVQYHEGDEADLGLYRIACPGWVFSTNFVDQMFVQNYAQPGETFADVVKRIASKMP